MTADVAAVRVRGPGRALSALVTLALLATPAAAGVRSPCPAMSRADLAPAVGAAALRTGLPSAWITAVIDRESARVPCAVSPKGAIGLMQLMPATWANYQARLALGPSAFEPSDNVLAGAAYLRELYDRFGARGMLAAYNAGPGRYQEALGAGRALPAETAAYVAELEPKLALAPAEGAKVRAQPGVFAAIARADPAPAEPADAVRPRALPELFLALGTPVDTP